jgi:LacI family transcriptional regulator
MGVATKPVRRPTMADVGRLAGVSAATVSFVLNENSGQAISLETRQRVHDAVASLGYRRNYLARSLRTRRTATVGFVTDEIAIEPYAGATILGAHDVAWAQGSLLVVVNTTRDRRILGQAIEELFHRRVDSVILAVLGTRRITVPDALLSVPTVLVNGFARGGVLPSVLPDEAGGGRTAAEMLFGVGHSSVAFLTGPTASWATRARLKGFRDAVVAHGLRLDDQIVLHGDYRLGSGYELTQGLIAAGRLPTAILCGNDRMATGTFLALAEAGLKVPQDVSVVGYDDQPQLAEFLQPPLSTVRLPYYEMGRWAAEQLLTGDVARLPPRTYLPCPAVPRDSVERPSR